MLYSTSMGAVKKNIYNIPAEMSFVDELAKGVLQRFGKSQIELSKVTIFLPNLRSIASLKHAFLRQTEGQSLLLPKMKAIGDYEDSDITRMSKSCDVTEIKSAISPLKRQMLLAQLIMESNERRSPEDPEINIEQAHHLAYELARFLDDVQKYNLCFEDLEKIVPEDLAKHWQETLNFFRLISQFWPEKLESMGLLDPWQRKYLMAESEVNYWQNHPITQPIIIAGTTGSIPSTLLIIKEILDSEYGHLVLPSLDVAMDNAQWDIIEEHHPQYGMKELLHKVGVEREDVEVWTEYLPHPRRDFISHVMSPMEGNSRWREFAIRDEACDNLEVIEAETAQQEAEIIALILRRQLEDSHKNGALITNDRSLARRVCVLMKKWQIEIDDSAGVALLDTAAASFMRLIMMAIDSRFSPIEFLSLLKHPFATFGYDPVEINLLIAELEKHAFRGVRKSGEIEGLIAFIESNEFIPPHTKKNLTEMLASVHKDIDILQSVVRRKKVRLSQLLHAHIACAEAIAHMPGKNGEERLWLGEEGEQISTFLTELIDSVDPELKIDTSEYMGLFNTFWLGKKYRHSYGIEPRLHILSPIEARLQNFDLVILAGMNQGSWPEEVNSPWMSKSMRKNFGLPSSSRMAGLLAHDFSIFACARNVVITRSKKVMGADTISSPWLLRMMALLESQNKQTLVAPTQPWQQWVKWMNMPESMKRILPPEPNPCVSVRPKKLSVTNIERWIKDPYSIYAKYVLKLRKLDDIDKEAAALEFGNIIHKALETYMNQYEGNSFEEEVAKLLKCGRQSFAAYVHQPSVEHLWWTRFEEIARKFVEYEMQNHTDIKEVKTEINGQWKISDEHDFTITANADRINILKNGGVEIIDYKTGQPPSSKAVLSVASPQLSLEAIIAEKNGFLDVKGEVVELVYWQVSPSEMALTKLNLQEYDNLLSDTYTVVCQMVDLFYAQNIAYLACPNDTQKPKAEHNDYEHLERTKEWSI